jgi:hypothetical protein
MAKRALSAIITTAVVTVLGLLSLTGPADAATPSFSESVTLIGQGSYDTATLPSPAGAGDCVRTAASVRLAPIAGTNNTQAVVTWYSTAYTTHTSNADIWNVKFDFITSDGRVAAASPVLRGARMSRINTSYGWSQSAIVQLDPSLYRILTDVRAYNSC